MKEQQSVSVGANAVVRIKVQGDLRVQSHDAAEVMAASDERFSVTAEGNQGAWVDADGDVNVRVPADAKIVIENVGGSARVRDIGAAVEIGGVGGDLSLKRCAFGDRNCSRYDRLPRFSFKGVAAIFDRFLHDLLLKHHDRVDEHFRTRRTARDIDIDGNDLVNALNDRVVVENSA